MPGGLSDRSAEESARSRIVTAAFALLAARGIQETSIKEVARVAGVAPGLVHYYFDGKQELLLEVVRAACRAFRDEMTRVPLPEDAAERTRALLRWSKQRALEEPDWYRLLVGLDSLALRDEALAREVAVLKREVRAHVAELVEAAQADLGAPLGPSPEAVAAVVMVAVDGLVVQRLIDPSFDLDDGFAALEALLVSLIERAATR